MPATAQETRTQQQHAWHLHDGRATEPFAAVAAHSVAELLDGMGIQEPSRGQILRAAPSLAIAVAWALYVGQESGLANPAGYLIRRLTGGDDPPEDFLKLTRMSWEQWGSARLSLTCRGSCMEQSGYSCR